MTAVSSPNVISVSIEPASDIKVTVEPLPEIVVVTVADRLIYATGVDAFAVTAFSAFGRSLIDDANSAAARTTLELGSMALQAANAVAITGGTIDGIDFDGGTF